MQKNEFIFRTKRAIESGLEVARCTGQDVEKSFDQLKDEAERLIDAADDIGLSGQVYLQLHLGKLSLASNQETPLLEDSRFYKPTFMQSSEIWDSSKPDGVAYSVDIIDRVGGSPVDFEPHMRMALFNEQGRFAYFKSLPIMDGESRDMTDALWRVQQELEIVKPKLKLSILNLMGILALHAQGNDIIGDKSCYVYHGEILVPVLEKTSETGKVGIVELHRGRVELDVMEPRASLEEMGIGLSVGLTD